MRYFKTTPPSRKICCSPRRYPVQSHYHGFISMEAVMVAAIMVPLAYAIYFLAVRVSVVINDMLFHCISWPYP